MLAMSLWANPAAGEPFAVKNHSPVWLGLLFPTPDTASAAKTGEWRYRADMDYSNIFFIPTNGAWSFLFDMELAQLTLDARYGIADGLEAGVEQPFFHMGGGFLDDAVTKYHSAMNFPMYAGQQEAPHNRFMDSVFHNGRTWNSANPYTITNGDATLWLKKELFWSGESAISVKLLTQAPTSSTSSGMGNGAWEWGGVMMANHPVGSVEASLAVGYLNPGFIDRGEHYTLNGFYYWDAAMDWRLASRWSAIGQVTGATSPYAADTPLLVQRQWMALTIGTRHITQAGNKVEISITEDLSFSAPDFTIHIGVQF